jgi:hypothetical protein
VGDDKQGDHQDGKERGRQKNADSFFCECLDQHSLLLLILNGHRAFLSTLSDYEEIIDAFRKNQGLKGRFLCFD